MKIRERTTSQDGIVSSRPGFNFVSFLHPIWVPTALRKGSILLPIALHRLIDQVQILDEICTGFKIICLNKSIFQVVKHCLHPTPRIALFVGSFVCPWQNFSPIWSGVLDAAWAPEEGRKGRSQAGPKGHQQEVGAQRASYLLVFKYFWILKWF